MRKIENTNETTYKYQVIHTHNDIDRIFGHLLQETERGLSKLRNVTLPTEDEVNELNEKLGSIMDLSNDQYYDKRREISNNWESKYLSKCLYGFTGDPLGNYREHMRYTLQQIMSLYSTVFYNIEDIMYHINRLESNELEALEVIIADNYESLSNEYRTLNAINRKLFHEFGKVDTNEIEGMLRKFIDAIIVAIDRIPSLILPE